MSNSHRGKTSAEELHSYGIELSQRSLVAALANANPRVRVLAAHQLESEGDSDAVPAIEDALSREKDVQAGVGIATALAALHDSRGGEYLQATCANSTLPIRVVFEATQMLQLLNIPSGECASAIITSLNRPSDRDYRDVVLSLLPVIYTEVTHQQSVRILHTIQNLLNDETQQPSVRLAAGQALAQIGLPSSIDVLRKAMLKENDLVMRESLRSDLKALENSKK